MKQKQQPKSILNVTQLRVKKVMSLKASDVIPIVPPSFQTNLSLKNLYLPLTKRRPP